MAALDDATVVTVTTLLKSVADVGDDIIVFVLYCHTAYIQ